MYHIGSYDKEPLRHGADQAPCLAGINAAAGVLLALLNRDRDGAGQCVDVSMQECLAVLLGSLELSQYAYTGGVARRGAKDGPGLNGIIACADGYAVPIAFGAPWCWVTIAVAGDAQWQALCREMAQADLGREQRFVTEKGRKIHEDELNRIVNSWTSGLDRFEVMRRLQATGIAAGAVQTTRDLFFDDQLDTRGFFEQVDHRPRDPELGVRPYVGRGWRLSRTPGFIQGPAPGLGEHNASVLQGLLGVPPENLARLQAQGVTGDAPAEGTAAPATTPPEERIAQGRWASWDPQFEWLLGLAPSVGLPLAKEN